MRLAEEAEAGTAGEQPAKEYSAETHRDDEGSGRSGRPPGVRYYIGTIDFPMPWKTQSCGRQRRCPEQVLKRLRRTVAQCRMEPFTVVILFQELLHVGFQIRLVAILPGMDFLLFEGLHKAFAFGIIVGIAKPAHAGYQAVFG